MKGALTNTREALGSTICSAPSYALVADEHDLHDLQSGGQQPCRTQATADSNPQTLCSCRLYVAPADAPMGQLDILPNTPKLWQSLAHELVRPMLAETLRALPVCGTAVSGALQIHHLSLSVLDGHLEHVLGRTWCQGTSAVKPHINQVRVQP